MLARRIMESAKTYSISSRSVYATTKKISERAEKIQLAGRSETGMFAQMILMHRRKLKHRGVILISPGSPEWVNLKETCKLATEFCNEFGIPIKEGYNAYLEIAIGMMKNFRLTTIKSMHSSICTTYESLQEIAHDKTPVQTTMMYELYLRKINLKLGWESNDYKSNPNKYVCFVRAKEAAVKAKIDMKVYIAAQFAMMEQGDRSFIPDPLQLYGDKAMERVRKFCYEHNITQHISKKLDLKKIKNAG